MYIFGKFYNSHGIRRLQQLNKPPMARVGVLYLPLGSAYHCTDIDVENVGVMPDDEIISHVKSEVIVDHITDLSPDAVMGNPSNISFSMNNLILDYHKKNKQFRRLNNNSLLKNPKSLVVYSYNLIARHYRYSPTILTPYHQWANMLITVVSTINRGCSETDRNQFLQVHMPLEIPPMTWLENAIDRRDKSFMDRFNTDSLRILADIYTWVGERRELSILSKLEDRYLDRVNILFLHAGQWTALNLGSLDKWRLKEGEVKKGDKLEPKDLKRRYIRFLMSVNEIDTVVDTLPNEDDSVMEMDDVDSAKKDIEDAFDDGVDESRNLTKEIQDKINEQKSGSLTDASAKIQKKKEDDSDDDIIDEDVELTDKQIDSDLAELEKIAASKEQETKESGFYKSYEPPEVTPESGVARVVETLARQGRLSAAEHRRLIQLSTRYKQIKNPYNEKETLEQMIKINPEDLAIGEKTPLAENIPGVLDQSMLSSSLKDFDNTYIRKILSKDIAAAVMHLQQMGVIVQNYTVHEVNDFTDSFEILTVNVIPVTGKPTTLRIQLPKVNENGQFKAGGVKSRMRKQRGDLPIRKTAPDTVALTSYVSKMFVKRTDRSNFNYDKWLTSVVMNLSLNGDGTLVSEVRMSDVFTSDVHLPRVYTILARKLSSFKFGIYNFSFDWANRIAFYGLEMATVLDKFKEEKLLLTPVAKSFDTILLIDKYGDLHEVSTVEKGKPKNVGSFESFIGIDESNKPHDVAEVGIFGKEIPLGFVLGYHTGLGNLLATLKTKFRRMSKGSSYGLTEKEFAIKFEDETLIIEKNGINELVLGGFNRYAKQIKRYSVYAFDKKEVYANVLDDNGIGVRWVREFGLLYSIWVDHITRDILIEMKEPTDLYLLFIRAAELLLTDQSPHQMDNTYMRDKGYERFAGMVYFELAKSLRGYASRPANASASVELNPQAVWMGILQDQSVMPIEESNPVHSLREKEEIIYSGAGGRTARSMTASARIFHESSKGVVSESTKDSGDAATVVYTTADPNYTTLRGTSRRLEKDEGNATKLVSTSMLLAPGAQHDDQIKVLLRSDAKIVLL